MINVSRIEMSRSAFENTGTRLEAEYTGNIDKSKYNELAYEHLFGNPADKETDPDEKFAKILSFKEQARIVFEDTLALSDQDKYINFKNSMKLVEMSQLGDPENPSRFFAKALYNSVKEKFVDKYILKFFTASGGTHLDVKHKIDCFFKLYNKETKEELSQATIDLTSNTNKQTCRADILLYISDEEKNKFDSSSNNTEYDREFFKTKIDEYATQIAKVIVENYKNRNQ